MEAVDPDEPVAQVQAQVATLKNHLMGFGLGESLRLCTATGAVLPTALAELTADSDADLLLSFQYSLGRSVVERFRRSALVDIDPGLLQGWMSAGEIVAARHDVYFTIGETVGKPGARFPNGGVSWQHTPPCVALDEWPVQPASPAAPFTTVSHWYADEWAEEGGAVYRNDKRSGFLPFLDLPRRTRQPLELALCLGTDDQDDWETLRGFGWRVRHAHEVTASPAAYRGYVQSSRGEFSCTKPSYVRRQTAWISDRTLCYLASAKPAIVQHTGPSRFLPDRAGLFRFRDGDEAARHLDAVAADYERQCRLARALAEEYFDARKVVKKVLERALE
jgi:hypothetical protein